MSRKIVILVEPSFFGVSYVREAKKLDCHVVVVVSDKNNPQIYGYTNLYDDMLICDIRDPEAIYQVIQESQYQHIDGLISATDYAIPSTSKAAEMLGLKYMSYTTALYVRNKDIARCCYAENNVPSARFCIVKTREEAEAAALKIGLPVVLKPTNCASSQHVYFIDNMDDLNKAFTEIELFDMTYMGFKVRDEYLVEEYLDGPEFSVEIFVENGKVVFAEVTEKITSALPFFVEEFHVFPTSIFLEEKQAMVDVAAQALDTIGLVNGPAHVEVRCTFDGPKIVEVNGRPGGDSITSDLLPTAYHVDIFRQTIRNLLGLSVDFKTEETSSSAIGFICAPDNGKFVAIPNLNILDEDKAVVRYNIGTRSGDEVRVPESSDDRLGYVIVNMPTPEEAKAKITSLIKQLIVNVEANHLKGQESFTIA